MATQEVRVHTVTIHGGFLREMQPEQAKLFLEKGKRSRYSDWDYNVKGLDGNRYYKTSEEWKAYYTTKSFEELQEEFPKFEALQLDLQDEELLEIVMNKVQFDLVSTKTLKVSFTPSETMDTLYQQTMKMAERFSEQLTRMSANTFNQKCNVHSGSVSLQEYNQMLLLEDPCTDMVQRHLNDGWRIIAVCVQPDQRRPDYVLGKKVEFPDSEAKRCYL